MATDKTIDQQIEEQHINPILEAENGNAEANTTTSTEGQDGQGGQTQTQTDGLNLEGVGKGGQQNNAEQQPQGQAPANAAPANQAAPGQQQPQPGHVKPDAKGNLVDASGKIVAAAGSERRLYEKVQASENVIRRQEQYIRQLETNDRQYREQMQQFTPVVDTMRQMQMNPQQTMAAMAIASKWRTDPLGVVKTIVDEAKAAGYDVTSLLSGKPPEPGQFDPNAVGRMITQALDQRLAPITQREAATQREADIQRVAHQQYTAFMAKHPHADKHEDVLTTLMQRDNTLTPESAYYRLQVWAAQNGLDFTQPLNPQIEARQRGNTAPANNAATNVNQQQGKPMTGGRGAGSNVTNQPQVHSPDDSTDDIVRAAMREAGLGANF